MSVLDVDYPRALLGTLVVVVLVALLVAGATSSTAFGAFNPSWDGASALRGQADAAGVDADVIRETAEIEAVPPAGSTLVVLSPDRPYSSTDVARIDAFVRSGGTLFVAEDFGQHTNPLLSQLNASARIGGTPLRDERHNYRSPALPVANNVSNHTLVSNVSALTLNHGTVVRPNGATVLVNSSSFAYLDRNRNDELDDDETIDHYPVATVEQVGDGRVIVVSDPSVFINAMLDRPGNDAFTTAVFAGSERVVLDSSHTADVPPLVRALMLVRQSPLVQLLVGLVGLGAIALWTRRPGLRSRVRNRLDRSTIDPFSLSVEEMAAAVETRHPDWDDERIRRVTQRMNETGGSPSPDRDD